MARFADELRALLTDPHSALLAFPDSLCPTDSVAEAIFAGTGRAPARIPRPRHELFTVLVAEEQLLLREAMSARLRTMGAGTVHQAESLAQARARARAHGRCDLAVISLGLPDGSGLDLLAELRSQGWRRLVVLARVNNPHTVWSAFRAGARGCLFKRGSAVIVTGALSRVLDGGVSAAPGMGPPRAAGARIADAHNRPAELSAREVEVLALVADGQSNKEIGTALYLSADTIKTHLARLGRKLGTGDRAHMVGLAMRAGIIP
jgi:DNA-binding NarL/FixJ family response regulator